jgi:hypothetical protein
MKKQSARVLLAVLLSGFLWSCNQKDPAPEGSYVQGVFVVNEGNFSQNNGTISFFKREAVTADADIFNLVNKVALQGGIQGYAVAGDRGLILVDNNKAGLDQVQIVDANTFEVVASIGTPDIENPREVVVVSNKKAYVSCWGTNADYSYKTGYVAVVDLSTNKVTKKIAIANGPENMVFSNGKVFVGTTSYATGKVLTVITTATDEIAKSVTFTGAPLPIGVDANGQLWVNAGILLHKVGVESNAIETTLNIGSDASKSASNFAFSNDLRSIFFVLSYYDVTGEHGGTYKLGITDTQINTGTPLIKRLFTGLRVDPSQGLLYAGVSPSYTQAGYAIRYRADGSVVDSVKVGIAPTGFIFR